MRDRAPEGLRLAVFSPVPPAPTGVADYVAGLLPLLPDDWEIDLFVEDVESGGDTLVAGRGHVHPHAEWRHRHRDRPYDLQIYQIGNNAAHAYALPYVTAVPGLLVLHDAVLHGSRVARHLAQVDLDGYRDVATRCRPDIGAALHHLVAAGLAGPAIYRAFPLCEDLVRASRRTVVHGEPLAEWLRELVPGAVIEHVAHWVEAPRPGAEAVASWRERVGAGEEVPVLGTFGYIGAAHRLDLVLEVLADLAGKHDFRLVVAGEVDPALKLDEFAREAGIADRVHWAGRLPIDDFGAVMKATDIAFNLRYPTARASSGTLQQLLQLGTAVIIHDLVHQTHIPEDAVARVPTGTRDVELEALRAVVDGWLSDPDARERVAERAGAWAATEITPAAMRESYVDAIARTLESR